MKKALILFMALLILFSFSACGCDHEWKEATCSEPKTCILCGATEGETVAHSWNLATCDTPRKCSNCELTEGKPMGHNYSKGYCTRCNEKNPYYVDLNEFGFSNMYDMTEWVEIYEYNFSEGSVKGREGYKTVNIFQFYDNYFRRISTNSVDELKSSKININSGDLFSNIVFTRMNNNSINSEDGAWTIFERIVDSNNKKLVLKTKLSGDERWFVPLDLLDLPESTLIEGEDYYDTYIKMYFK